MALRLTMNSNTRDNAVLRFVTSREVLIEDFEIYSASDGSERIVIPPGDYSFNEIRAGVLSGNSASLPAASAPPWATSTMASTRA